jgi:hypothetical protein
MAWEGELSMLDGMDSVVDISSGGVWDWVSEAPSVGGATEADTGAEA